jgi:hypothetical protein
MLTPVLKWENIELLQAIIRAIRHAGAKTPSTTSQHVHVGVAGWTAEQLTNLVRIHYKQEALIQAHAIGREPGKVAWTMRQALLAPDIVHRILSGDIPQNLTLEKLRAPLPDLWEEQRAMLFGE